MAYSTSLRRPWLCSTTIVARSSMLDVWSGVSLLHLGTCSGHRIWLAAMAILGPLLIDTAAADDLCQGVDGTVQKLASCVRQLVDKVGTLDQRTPSADALVANVAKELAEKHRTTLRGEEGNPGPVGPQGRPGTDAALPFGTVAWFSRPSCPSGWTVAGEVVGRYVVGVRENGPVGATVGQPLAEGENRPTGWHQHNYQDGVVRGDPPEIAAGSGAKRRDVTRTTGGPVGDPPQGTNAPYVLLLACRKS